MTDLPAEPDAPAPVAGTGRRSRLLDVVRIVLVVAALTLGAVAIGRDLDGFRRALATIGVGRVAVAFALTLLGTVASAEVWRRAVVSVAGPLPFGTAARVFFVTQLGKYLPGAVWTVVGQIDLAGRHGLARSKVGIGALLFLAFHAATAVVVAAASLPWAAPELVATYPWVFVLGPLLALALAPPILTRAIAVALRLLRRPALPERLTARDVAGPSVWMLATWACFGAGVTVVAWPLATGGSATTLIAAATGGFALAWIVGLLVLPAPAGLGAREVVLSLVLVPLVGVTGATSVVVLVRVVHTAADLLLAAATGWRRRGRSGTSR